MSDAKLFFDTDCISAFLWVDEQAILPKLYPGRIVIPEPVYDELSNPRIPHLKQRIDVMKSKGQVRIVSVQHGEPEYDSYMRMTNSPGKGKTIIGKGEASVLVLAKENDGIETVSGIQCLQKDESWVLIRSPTILKRRVENRSRRSQAVRQ